MTKSHLAQIISERAGITKVKAEAAVDTVFDCITEALLEDQRVEIRGFGSFANRYYQSYEGRNPKTGKASKVKDKYLPVFKTGKKLREEVDQSPAAIRARSQHEDPNASSEVSGS